MLTGQRVACIVLTVTANSNKTKDQKMKNLNPRITMELSLREAQIVRSTLLRSSREAAATQGQKLTQMELTKVLNKMDAAIAEEKADHFEKFVKNMEPLNR